MEVGETAFGHGLHALLPIGGLGEDLLLGSFTIRGVTDGLRKMPSHRLLDGPDGQGRRPGDLEGEVVGGGPDLVVGDEAIEQADPMSFFAIDPRSGVEQFECSLLADQRRQRDAQAEALVEAESSEVGRETGSGSADAEVGHTGQAEAAADRRALDGRHDRQFCREEFDGLVVDVAFGEFTGVGAPRGAQLGFLGVERCAGTEILALGDQHDRSGIGRLAPVHRTGHVVQHLEAEEVVRPPLHLERCHVLGVDVDGDVPETFHGRSLHHVCAAVEWRRPECRNSDGPRTVSAMPLDPTIQPLVDLINAAAQDAPPVAEQTAQMRREAYHGLVAAAGPGPDLHSVEDTVAPGPGGDIGLRVYRPTEAPSAGIVIFYHGGGWCIGDLDTHDEVCRSLAAQSGQTVVAVDYRLGPEHRFPAAVEDAWAALEWIAANRSSLAAPDARLAVSGDSAGGNLAAVVSLMARDAGGPEIAAQLLVYPGVDMSFDTERFPSHGENAEGYILTAETMEWFGVNYLESEADRDDWRASPLRAASFENLPAAVVITA